MAETPKPKTKINIRLMDVIVDGRTRSTVKAWAVDPGQDDSAIRLGPTPNGGEWVMGTPVSDGGFLLTRKCWVPNEEGAAELAGFLTVAAAARVLGHTAPWIKDRIIRGELHVTRRGGRVYVTRDSVDALNAKLPRNDPGLRVLEDLRAEGRGIEANAYAEAMQREAREQTAALLRGRPASAPVTRSIGEPTLDDYLREFGDKP